MTADIYVGNRLRDLRHVARDTLAAGAALPMMCMLLERGDIVRTVRRADAMARQTQVTYRLDEIGVVARTVYVVTTEAGYPSAVHHALHEIVPLHAIFVSRAVSEMRERRLTDLVFFELPVIA